MNGIGEMSESAPIQVEANLERPTAQNSAKLKEVIVAVDLSLDKRAEASPELES